MPAAKGKKGSKKTSKSKNDFIEVNSAKDLPNFLDLFKNGGKNTTIIVMLTITMEGCPHCDTLDQDILSKLKSVPNKKVTLAKMAHDQVANVPALSNIPLEGYPSVLLLGKDMKPAAFKDNNGNTTYSIPEARNLSTMKNIVTQEPTESNLSAIPNMETPPNVGTFETKPYENKNINKNTLSLNEDVKEHRMEDPANVNEIIRKSKSGTTATMNKVSPPNLEEDVLNSQLSNTSSMEFKGKKSIGGSLYKSLIDDAGHRVMPGGSRKVGRRKGRKTRRN